MTVTRDQASRNRQHAAQQGARTFTGTRCRAAGHDGTRYTSTGACIECMAARYQQQIEPRAALAAAIIA